MIQDQTARLCYHQAMDTSAHQSLPAAFWSLAFAGATPPAALGMALQNGLIDRTDFEEHAPVWLSTWLSGTVARMTDAYDLTHRPWRQFSGAGREGQSQQTQNLPARLDAIKAGTEEAGLLSLFQGFVLNGWPLDRPVENVHWANTLLEAAVGMNVPSVIDWVKQQPNAPSAKALDQQWAPVGILGERQRLPWLHMAALAWQDTLLEALLDYGLDPNHLTQKGESPLFFARTERAVKALLAAGANPALTDKIGVNAAHHWEKASFPWGQSAKALGELMGEQAADPSVVSLQLLTYLEKGPLTCNQNALEHWLAKMPQFQGALHEARYNPGGTWKGDWSPAAWVGLKAVYGKMYYNYHLAYLLGRDDFISPTDYAPKGQLTERGLLGLGLLEMIGEYPLHKPTDDRQPRWFVADAADRKLGENWFDDPAWRDPMFQTSKALLGVKSTPKDVRFYINEAWRYRFTRKIDSSQMAQRLWEAKDKAGIQFVSNHTWDALFQEHVPASYQAAFFLLRAGDLFDKEMLENKGKSVGEVFQWDGREVGYAVKRAGHLIEEHGFARVDPRMDAAIHDAMDKISQITHLEKGPALSALLKEYRLTKACDQSLATGRNAPRM